MEWVPLILNFLQPLLLKCFDRQSTEDPQEVLRESYDPTTGKMDPAIVNDAIPQTRRAFNRARKSASREERRNAPRYSRQELYDITEKGLIESMNAPPETVASVRTAAALLRDNDD
jgi:hypothetical protein